MARRNVVSDAEESEVEGSTPNVPRDAELEKALRDTVAEVYKAGKLEELTVRRVRTAAENRLGLGEGFFKGDSHWKAKSEEIIKQEVQIQDAGVSYDETEGSTGDGKSATPHDAKIIEPRVPKTQAVKRAKSADVAKPRKRRKTTSPLHSEPEGESPELSELPTPESDDEEDEVRKPAKSRKKSPMERPAPSDSESDSSDAQDDTKESRPSTEADEGRATSESEMSVVLDEAPKPIRKRQKRGEGASRKASSRKGGKKAASKGKDEDLDPDKEEIKRLQGWLVKCGIRKMWFRELAPYPTSKAKIKHLKDMLKEAGMEGRYSLEKARQIREERELKADLEMVQEGAKRWGTGSAEDGGDGDKPRRRLNRGLKSLAFLDSDGEETD